MFSSSTTRSTDTNAAIPTKSTAAEQSAESTIFGNPRLRSGGISRYVFFKFKIKNSKFKIFGLTSNVNSPKAYRAYKAYRSYGALMSLMSSSSVAGRQRRFVTCREGTLSQQKTKVQIICDYAAIGRSKTAAPLYNQVFYLQNPKKSLILRQSANETQNKTT